MVFIATSTLLQVAKKNSKLGNIKWISNSVLNVTYKLIVRKIQITIKNWMARCEKHWCNTDTSFDYVYSCIQKWHGTQPQ